MAERSILGHPSDGLLKLFDSNEPAWDDYVAWQKQGTQNMRKPPVIEVLNVWAHQVGGCVGPGFKLYVPRVMRRSRGAKALADTTSDQRPAMYGICIFGEAGGLKVVFS